ncbi:hypothetical protein [Oceanibacterium hippocampi]|uniref:Uncharacterized protein n=1 Tax=Oceanibacterium hippocampi TaxID=745714 RepID=A0A1Y5TRD1_9PROT|nr:hypothetical protein [Oceanibacterium hippocampi]SLN70255.1 hypothetical protein OCH7691_03266 [Oceanibacterium hippocampi]
MLRTILTGMQQALEAIQKTTTLTLGVEGGVPPSYSLDVLAGVLIDLTKIVSLMPNQVKAVEAILQANVNENRETIKKMDSGNKPWFDATMAVYAAMFRSVETLLRDIYREADDPDGTKEKAWEQRIQDIRVKFRLDNEELQDDVRDFILAAQPAEASGGQLNVR